MKKLVFAMFAFSLMTACGGEESAEGSEETVDTDSTETSDETDGQLSLEDFEYFEDYGQISDKTTLYEVLGEENLSDDTAWFAEGTTMFMCTDFTHPDNGWMIRYVFGDEDPETVNFIETHWQNYDDNYEDLGVQEVKAANGLYTGMPLEELLEWNGGDFDFSGFGWDYEGGINAPEDSKISKSPVMISLTMDNREGFDEKYQELYGDIIFNSADDKVKGAPIVVAYMSYFIEPIEIAEE